jgi:hypothetical protein
MGLIAYFQKAWLLVLEQELFETVAALNEGDSDQFRTRIEAVHQEIAEFTTRYWFTEVSSQVQPQELFEWWLDRLGTPKLYGQLLEEVRSVDHVLNAVRDRRRNREMSILTWVGTVGLALGLGINFLGMNVISRDLDKWYASLLGTWAGHVLEWGTVVVATGGFVALIRGMFWFFRKRDGA